MSLQDLKKRVENRSARICVVGIGYVGLPLAVEFAKKGFFVTGYDVNQKRVDELNSGNDPTRESDEAALTEMVSKGKLAFTIQPEEIRNADFIVIAVPTPITDDKKPDLAIIESASETVGRNLREGSLVVTESSVYPGVTEEVMLPILEKESGMKVGKFYLGYSPERVNPGDKEHNLLKVVKIVSGYDDETRDVVAELYSTIIEAGVCEASDIKTAEAAKIIENVQRDLNIALVNEFALLFKKMGVNVQEVLDIASTKWNFHNYKPGLVGGHCIPVDPYYLVYKSEKVGHEPRIILSGRNVNNYMPLHVVELVIKALNRNAKLAKNANILLLGLTFKKNVPDVRNSPSKVLIGKLREYGANIIGHDPLITHETIEKEYCIKISDDVYDLKDIDCVVLVTDHDKLKDIEFSKLSFRGKPIMIDVRSFYDRKSMEGMGFDYETL